LIENHIAFFAEHWRWDVASVLALTVSRRQRLIEVKQDSLHNEREALERAKHRARR